MVSLTEFRKWSLDYPETSEAPHFEKTSFRVRKKIFATCDAKNHKACVKLSLTDQDLFSLADKSVVYALPNKWGQMGWTNIELKQISKKMCRAMLDAAYGEVAPVILSKSLPGKSDKK